MSLYLRKLVFVVHVIVLDNIQTLIPVAKLITMKFVKRVTYYYSPGLGLQQGQV